MVGGFLHALGARIGARFVLEDSGVCRLRYGADLDCTVEVPESSDALHLHAPLIDVVAGHREALFHAALTRNLHGLQTGGCFMAYEEASHGLVLCYTRLLAGLDAGSFETILVNFVAVALRVRGELTDVAHGLGLPGADASEPGRSTFVTDDPMRHFHHRA